MNSFDETQRVRFFLLLPLALNVEALAYTWKVPFLEKFISHQRRHEVSNMGIMIYLWSTVYSNWKARRVPCTQTTTQP